MANTRISLLVDNDLIEGLNEIEARRRGEGDRTASRSALIRESIERLIKAEAKAKVKK